MSSDEKIEWTRQQLRIRYNATIMEQTGTYLETSLVAIVMPRWRAREFLSKINPSVFAEDAEERKG